MTTVISLIKLLDHIGDDLSCPTSIVGGLLWFDRDHSGHLTIGFGCLEPLRWKKRLILGSLFGRHSYLALLLEHVDCSSFGL